jgi:antitoxin component YwqK of YwqJK toxin-antitoxin module
MKKLLLYFLLLVLIPIAIRTSLLAQASPDSGFTNKTEAKNVKKHGKKQGKWIEYYSYEDEADNVHIVNDSASAASYVLTYYKDDLPVGIQRDYFKDGTLNVEIPYVNGKINGILKRYDTTGKVGTEETYSNDKLNGAYIEYCCGGKIKDELFYVNDEQTGVYKEYYESGKLKSEVTLLEGDKNGIEKTYYESGKLASQTLYATNKVIMTFSYDENGKEIKK